MNTSDPPSPPVVACVADLATFPMLWPWRDCCCVFFEIFDLNVEATVHTSRDLAEQLSAAASLALQEWVDQSSVYDLELFNRDGCQFAATTFNDIRVEAVMHGGDWASALFDAIIPGVFSHLLGLPLADIVCTDLPGNTGSSGPAVLAD